MLKRSLIVVFMMFIGVTMMMLPVGECADWPKDNIFINVHAGTGNLDTAMRLLAKPLSEKLGVNVVVVNRPGGSQAISQVYTQGQPADGYNFQTFTGSTSFAMASGTVPFEPENWSLVASVQQEPASIAVLADSKLKTMDDFINAMKEDPRSLVVGGYQSASFMRYVFYQMENIAGFKGTWIPIDTTSEVATALLGRHIDVAIMTPSTTGDAVKRGEVRLLGISTEERSDKYPGIPTFKEQGYDIVEVLWRGLGVKKGTDQAIIDKLYKTIMEIAHSDEWQEIQERYNQDNDFVTPEQLDERLLDEVTGRTKFLKEIGLLK